MTTEHESIMTMIFEKTEFTDEDYITIGKHFRRVMSCENYDRGNASQCEDCEHCEGAYDYNDIYVRYCGISDYNSMDDYDKECSEGYCPYREFGKDIVELLTSELNKTEEEP